MAEFETTRKGLAILLCMALAAAACALALAVAMPGHAFAAVPVCAVNGVEYEDFGTAIDEAPDGAAIVLLDDASVSGRDTSTNVYGLKITGGTFAVDVSSLLRSGYECVQNADGIWSVFDDVTASGYYTLADDGSRVKHENIASAIADGKGAVYVARDAVLSSADTKDLSAAGKVLASAPGVTVSFDGTAAELLADLSDAEDLNVTVNAASGTETLRGVGITGGKLVACTAGIASKNAAEYEPLLAENHVFDTTYSDYRIIALPAEGALVGSFWYADLDAAITAASIDDVKEPVCETIIMLSDAEGPIDIVYPKATFTIDFAGRTIKGGEGNGIVIVPVVIEQSVFEGGAALIEADPHANDAGNVSLEVNGGVFKGAVDSEGCTGFIKGGSFRDEGAGAFIAEDSTLVKGDDGMFGVQKKPESGEGEGGDQSGTDQGGKPADNPGAGSNQGDTLA